MKIQGFSLPSLSTKCEENLKVWIQSHKKDSLPSDLPAFGPHVLFQAGMQDQATNKGQNLIQWRQGEKNPTGSFVSAKYWASIWAYFIKGFLKILYKNYPSRHIAPQS